MDASRNIPPVLVNSDNPSNNTSLNYTKIFLILLLLVIALLLAMLLGVAMRLQQRLDSFAETKAFPVRVNGAVMIDDRFPLNVSVKNSSLDVEVRNTRLGVEIENPQIDVEVKNIQDINVNLQNHHIIRADPIPVRITN